MKDLTGERYGRLTVINFSHSENSQRYFWLCECDCGKRKIVRADHFKSGHTTSCGCVNVERLYKHGLGWSRGYSVWNGMISRCNNVSDKEYLRYGARGISVCERWLDVTNFIKDMGHPPTAKHQIDRINNDGDYEPSNCRWATRQENARNRRNNRMITIEGKTQCVSDWADDQGMSSSVIFCRLKRGWTEEDAIKKAVRVVAGN